MNTNTHESATAAPPVFDLRVGLRRFRDALTLPAASAGIVAAIFGCSGPALIVISAAETGNLTSGQTVSWLLAIYLLGGLISLVMALGYQQPITGAYSIPGAAIMTGALVSIGFDAAVGAFVMSGAIVLLLGLSGLVGRVMRWLPMPIVMAMIAGALIRFGIGAVDAIGTAPLVAGSAAVVYFLTQRFLPVVPPVLAALLVGLMAAFLTGTIQSAEVALAFEAPEFTRPVFTLEAFLAISIPLAVLVIGAENAQATGVLMAERYRPPVNAMTLISGVGGMLAGIMGGHNANIAGPMTAICSSSDAGEDRDKRYAATVVNGLLFGGFGLVAGAAVPLVLALPRALIGCIAGLAMISVLLSAFQQAFAKDRAHQVGAFVALVVAMSSFSLLGISSPFWALVFGVLVSLLLDADAFRHREESSAEGNTGRVT